MALASPTASLPVGLVPGKPGAAEHVAGCGGVGLEAAEAVIRAGMLKLGSGMLGELLAADPGYRGPRADCGSGHQAELTAYREKVIDTVLGPVTLKRPGTTARNAGAAGC